jgi:hypothetical protein
VDIVVPAPGASNIWYSVAGSELIVFQLGAGNTTAVLERIDLRALDLLVGQGDEEPLELEPLDNSLEALSVAVGLRQTLTATQLLQPAAYPSVLFVLGSAVESIGGVSPLVLRGADREYDGLAVSPSRADDGNAVAGWFSTTVRPFRATVAIAFDITDPARPAARAVTMVEGDVVTARAPDSLLWLVMRQTPHASYEFFGSAEPSQDVTDNDVMPVYRHWAGAQAGLVPWRRLTSCNAVDFFMTGGGTSAPGTSRLVTVLPLQLSGAALGEPQTSGLLSMALAWDRVRLCLLHCPHHRSHDLVVARDGAALY